MFSCHKSLLSTIIYRKISVKYVLMGTLVKPPEAGLAAGHSRGNHCGNLLLRNFLSFPWSRYFIAYIVMNVQKKKLVGFTEN